MNDQEISTKGFFECRPYHRWGCWKCMMMTTLVTFHLEPLCCALFVNNAANKITITKNQYMQLIYTVYGVP